MEATACPRMRGKEVAAYLGIHIATLWRWSKERAEFPKKYMDGAKFAYWLRSDVEHYALGGGVPAGADA